MLHAGRTVSHTITSLDVPRWIDPRRDAELRCAYTRQPRDPPLHSVKWYRAAHEIFRYTPQEVRHCAAPTRASRATRRFTPSSGTAPRTRYSATHHRRYVTALRLHAPAARPAASLRQVVPRCARDIPLHATGGTSLRCAYTRQPRDPPLHSVKWYRAAHEIFRYTPQESWMIHTCPVVFLHTTIVLSIDALCSEVPYPE
ncbi:putative neural cell adhesion molecule l1, partial [Operophtera brumata]